MKVYRTSSWVNSVGDLASFEKDMGRSKIPYVIMQDKKERFALYREASSIRNVAGELCDGELEDLLKKGLKIIRGCNVSTPDFTAAVAGM